MPIRIFLNDKEIDAEIRITTPAQEPAGPTVPALGRDSTKAPAVFTDALIAGWQQTEGEDWSDYPLGPVAQFDPAKWEPQFSHKSLTLNQHKEQGAYVSPLIPGTTHNPHSIVMRDGTRWHAITPRKTPAAELAASANRDFQSGVCSSLHSQTYGYYEGWHICPMFDGGWCASWIMGPSWWPEFDMIEHVAKVHKQTKAFFAIHYKDKLKTTNSGNVTNGKEVDVGTDLSKPFKLGGLWLPNYVATYINDKLIWEVRNPPKTPDGIQGLHDPAHRLMSFALTGKTADSWGGATTIDPAQITPFYSAKLRTFWPA